FETLGTRGDLRIIHDLASALGSLSKGTGWQPSHVDQVFHEILAAVPGYSVSNTNVLSGGAEGAIPSASTQALAGDGRGAILPAFDTLFTSGTLTRYSHILQAVPERLSRKLPDPC